MAETTVYNVDSSIDEVWARNTLRDHLRQGFWGRFIGGVGSGMPIIQMTELLNKSGDLIHIQVTNPLSGDGVEGDNATLEGNEENLTTSEIQVRPKLYRHGVVVRQRANKKSILDLRSEAKMRLAEWGMNKMDSVRWAQFVSATTTDVPDGVYSPNIVYASASVNSALDDLAIGDKLTVDDVKNARYKLMDLKTKPFKVNGLDFYAGVISPEQGYDLRQDTDYQNYVVNAASRGMDNPVFTGAICNIEGVVLYEHFNVPVVTNGGSVRCAKAMFFGQEFAVEGLDEDVTWVERDHFDYGAKWGVGYSFAFQPRRALELSSIQLRTAATKPI